MSDVVANQEMVPQQEEPVQSQEPANGAGGNPTNLAEALKLVQQREHEAAQTNVGTGSTEQAEPVNGQQPVEPNEQGGNIPAQADSGAGVGGSANVQQNTPGESWSQTQPQAGGERSLENFDVNGQKKSLLDEMTAQAINNINDLFSKNGIKKFTIQDLYQRNESTGQITFTNPDDPNHPFTSRTEAQSWIDSINQNIDAEWRRQVMENRNQLIKDNEVTLQLLDFVPTYTSMNKQEQDIFNTLIRPYGVVRGNKTIGYNCDLMIAAQQARQIAQTIPKQEAKQVAQGQQVPAQASTPALDIKGGTNTQAGTEAPPKNLAEALQRYQKQERAKNERKK